MYMCYLCLFYIRINGGLYMTEEEYKEWYKSCEFINNYSQFYSFNDFLEYHVLLYKLFKKMDKRTRRLYQWYIFAGDMNYSQKNAIWDFLNDNIPLSTLKLFSHVKR